MDDKDPLNERPYPSKGYEDMGFDELHRSIEDSLARHLNGDPAVPSTQGEFFLLLRLLRKKVPASSASHNARSRPRPLSPKQKLDRLRDKLERTEQFLLTYREKPSTSRKAIEDAERKWEELVREIRELDRKSYYVYDTASYWQGSESETALPSHLQMVDKLRKKVERAFRPAVTTTEYQWEAVPEGENPVDSIARSFKAWHRRNPHIAYDGERIEKARSLRPKHGYTGKRKFDGYFIYTFDYTDKMIMECPMYGNAVFVLGSSLEPEDWLQMKKQEIKEHPESKRIPHNEGWFERVKKELGVPEEDGPIASRAG